MKKVSPIIRRLETTTLKPYPTSGLYKRYGEITKEHCNSLIKHLYSYYHTWNNPITDHSLMRDNSPVIVSFLSVCYYNINNWPDGDALVEIKTELKTYKKTYKDYVLTFIEEKYLYDPARKKLTSRAPGTKVGKVASPSGTNVGKVASPSGAKVGKTASPSGAKVGKTASPSGTASPPGNFTNVVKIDTTKLKKNPRFTKIYEKYLEFKKEDIDDFISELTTSLSSQDKVINPLTRISISRNSTIVVSYLSVIFYYEEIHHTKIINAKYSHEMYKKLIPLLIPVEYLYNPT